MNETANEQPNIGGGIDNVREGNIWVNSHKYLYSYNFYSTYYLNVKYFLLFRSISTPGGGIFF